MQDGLVQVVDVAFPDVQVQRVHTVMVLGQRAREFGEVRASDELDDALGPGDLGAFLQFDNKNQHFYQGGEKEACLYINIFCFR